MFHFTCNHGLTFVSWVSVRKRDIGRISEHLPKVWAGRGSAKQSVSDTGARYPGNSFKERIGTTKFA